MCGHQYHISTRSRWRDPSKMLLMFAFRVRDVAGVHTVHFPHLLEHPLPRAPLTTSRRSRSTSLTPMRKRKGKGKYKGKRKSSVGRVQVPRICSSGLSSLLASGTESRSSLRLTLGEAVKRLWSYAAAHGLKDGRNLRCNAAMRQLFGVPVLTMFEVSGALSSHMKGAGSGAATAAEAVAPLPPQAVKAGSIRVAPPLQIRRPRATRSSSRSHQR